MRRKLFFIYSREARRQYLSYLTPILPCLFARSAEKIENLNKQTEKKQTNRGKIDKKIESGEIEIAPLAFMRGRTLSNAHAIIDEAQNTTPVQMKMVLTRLGRDSCMVITGDLSQVDLPYGQPSGLAEAARILNNIRGVGIIHLSGEDVVRHPVVARILQAYEAGQKPQNKNK